MRKYIRNMMRYDAKYQKAKPNRWVKAAFESFQLKRYGTDRRRINQAKGTHPGHLWSSRVALFASR